MTSAIRAHTWLALPPMPTATLEITIYARNANLRFDYFVVIGTMP